MARPRPSPSGRGGPPAGGAAPLDEVLSTLGVTREQLLGSSAARSTTSRSRYANLSGSRSQQFLEQPVTMRRGVPEGGAGSAALADRQIELAPDTTQQVGELLEELYGMDPEELAGLQQRLLYGGYYSDLGYYNGKKDLPLGVPDEDTERAYRLLLSRAVRSRKTIDEVLAASAAQGRARFEAAKRSGRQVRTFTEHDVENLALDLEAEANQYLVPLSDDAKREWARNILRGQQAVPQEEVQGGTA